MQNTSGYRPVSNLLLVRMDPIGDSHDGGLIQKPQQAVHDERLAQARCVCIAQGPLAWFREVGPDGITVPRCAIGDHILIEQWVGQYFKGKDGAYYRMIVDRNVIGLISEEEKQA